MSTLQPLLTQLQQQGVKLWLEDERLRVSAPQGVLTAELRTALTTHKDELLLLLEKHELEQIRPVPRSGREPLSFAQERLWFLQQLDDRGAYNMPAVLRLEGTLQLAALQTAINTIVARHESLRTTFVEIDGEVFQQIAPPTTVALPLTDLTKLPLAEQENHAHCLAEAATQYTFDLAVGPLLRLELIRFLPQSLAPRRADEWLRDEEETQGSARVHLSQVTKQSYNQNGHVPHPNGTNGTNGTNGLRAANGLSRVNSTNAPVDTPADAATHLLVFNMHHIISDGLSIGLLIEELSELYRAALTADSPNLPALPVQYADYAIWQRKLLRGKLLEAQANYWQEALAGAPPLLELATDYPRPAQQQYRGGTVTFTVDQATTMQLRRFSQERQTTLFMTLLTAYALLLSRYSNQPDILIGTPIAGRGHAALEPLIGLFINMLVMRIDLQENPTVNDLLAQVRQQTLAAFDHQDIPFERLLELLEVDRNLSYNPIFQVMFAMQTVDTNQITLPGLTLSQVEQESAIAKFDLSLMMTETSNRGLEGVLEYNSDLFAHATAVRMAGHFQNLLSAMVTQPMAPVATLPMLSDAERNQLLYTWNATAQAIPERGTLHHLIEAQVARTPDACALVDLATGNQLSYNALNQQANQLAHHLCSLAIAPDARVAIYLERSPLLLVALLGVLKAGAAYVPLDPIFPHARIELMLADAAPTLLITEAALGEELADLALPKLYLDQVTGETAPVTGAEPVRLEPAQLEPIRLSAYPTTNPITAVTGDNLAYLIYTSGSTGKPKGVELCHRSVVNFLLSMQKKPGVTAADRLLAVTTISFDIAVLELYLPLMTGATVLLADELISADPQQLMAHMANATVMQATPATWHMLLMAGWQGTPTLRALVGGEALPAALARQLLPRVAALWNLYGPTETTVWSSLQKVETTTIKALSAAERESTTLDDSAVAIGRPIANTQLYILDSHGQPQPIGVPGELYIGGAGLARGYRGLPDLTAEKFLINPFAPGRYYRTGDLARYRVDGTVAYLGRMDNQVKIRGFRIELGEIERLLEMHPRLQQAVVVAQGQSGDKRLVAFLIAREPQGETTSGAVPVETLRTFLRERLPEYMVPTVFVTLDALPLTPNGKVDRRRLMQMESVAADLATTYVPPTTPLEEQLVAIWAEVLKRDITQIGIHHNFFDLGGHSLLAIQLLSRMRTAFAVELPIRDLMNNPTIAGVATLITALQQLSSLFTTAADEHADDRESIEI